MSVLLDKVRELRANAVYAVNAESPAVRYRPLPVDYELAERLGLEGSRQQLLDATHLVAWLAGRDPWSEYEAMEALAAWWGRPVRALSAVELIVSAAHADEVMGCPRPRAGDEDGR